MFGVHLQVYRVRIIERACRRWHWKEDVCSQGGEERPSTWSAEVELMAVSQVRGVAFLHSGKTCAPDTRQDS